MSTSAKESRQVQKARRKLRNQILEEHKLLTENALKKMSEEIRTWISRHSKDRIKLKEKDFSLFDENQHPAKSHSRYVQHLFEQLSSNKNEPIENSLEGRVSLEVNEFPEEETTED